MNNRTDRLQTIMLNILMNSYPHGHIVNFDPQRLEHAYQQAIRLIGFIDMREQQRAMPTEAPPEMPSHAMPLLPGFTNGENA